MIAKLFLISAVVANAMVTANPLLQAVMPQSCPICERNALKNKIQNLLLQQTSNKFQPYAQLLFNQNPLPVQGITLPSNPLPIQGIAQPLPNKQSCVCRQDQQTTNQVVPCQQQQVIQPYSYPQQVVQPQNNPTLPPVLNNILSNPALRSILDPNTKLYNQNGLEVPRNGQGCNETPNIINNYIIIPPELLLEGRKSEPKKGVSEEKVFKTGNTNVRIIVDDSKGRKAQNAEEALDNRKLTKTERNSYENGRKKRRRQKNKNSELNGAIIEQNAEQHTPSNKVESLDRAENTLANITVENEVASKGINNLEQTTLSDLFTQTETQSFNEHVTESAPLQEALMKDDVLNNDFLSNKESESVNILDTSIAQIEILNSVVTTTAKPKRKRKRPVNPTKKMPTSPTHPREQQVIEDFKRKFPNIPEQVFIDLLEHMKRQLGGQNFASPAFYYPQYPINYEQLYRNAFMNFPFQPAIANPNTISSHVQKPSNNNQSKSRRRKIKRKNRRRKPRPNSGTNNKTELRSSDELTTIAPTTPSPVTMTIPITSTVEVTSTIEPTPTMETTTDVAQNEIETTTVAITTTEAYTPTTPVQLVTIKTDEDTQTIKTTTAVIQQEKKEQNREKSSEIKTPKLGSEDVVPVVYMNDLYDDYYPDFRNDPKYSSNEDFLFSWLEDDRYHYTTDKNYPLEELNRERRRFDNFDEVKRSSPYRRMFRLKNRQKPRLSMKDYERIPYFRARPVVLRPKEQHKVTERPVVKVTIKYEGSTDSKFKEETSTKEIHTESPKSVTKVDEIKFMTPPTLDKIDFETKPINKNLYFRDDFDYKISSYSDTKTPQYTNNAKDKNQNINTNSKPTDQIETVYARSKVVKYGNPNSDKPKSVVNDDINGHETIDYDDKTVVLAKSMDDEYW